MMKGIVAAIVLNPDMYVKNAAPNPKAAAIAAESLTREPLLD